LPAKKLRKRRGLAIERSSMLVCCRECACDELIFQARDGARIASILLAIVAAHRLLEQLPFVISIRIRNARE